MKKERLLLDEAFLNGKVVNTNVKPFLLEAEGGFDYLEKCKQDPNLPIYLVGIVQSGDKPNRNGRIYPWSYLKRECNRYLGNEVKLGLSYLELDHPEDSSTPSLDDAAGTIEDVWYDENKKDIWAKIKVLNAYMPQNAPGLKVRGFILNGKTVGVSSRALGSIENNSNSDYDVVGEDLELICWDFVSNASNYGSETLKLSNDKNLRENHNKKKMLTESRILKMNQGLSIKEKQLINLTEEEKFYLNTLGVEKFLRVKYYLFEKNIK